jgi:TRAP-type mannitol/chloroaromatic compound transport system substrate-binding protein
VTKKTLVLFLALGLVLSLVVAGCAPEAAPAPDDGEEEEAAPEEEEEEEPAAPADKVYSGTWVDVDGAGTDQNLILIEAAENMLAASGGRLDITISASGEIVPRDEGVPAVGDGVVDIASPAASMDMGRLGPVTYILGSSGLPAGGSVLDWVAWAYQGDGIEIMNDIYTDYGYCKGVVGGAAELFAHSHKPLTKASDFEGLKFRALGLWGEVLQESYGASVVQLPGGEVYSAMERGVIDAFELGPAGLNFAFGFQEIAEYVGLPGVQSPGYFKPCVVNKGWYDALPSDLQALFDDEVAALALRSVGYIGYENAVGIQKFKDYGTKFFYVDEDFQADIAAKSRAKCEEFAASDPVFMEVWEQQNEFFKVWAGTSAITPDYSIYIVD